MIYVMLPAYNEEKTVATVITTISQVLARGNEEYTIVVCDDGSSDETAQEVKRLREELPIALLRHPVNQGVAQAFRTLFSYAADVSKNFLSEDIFVVMEADQTSDPELLPSMVRQIQEGHDVVCASRYRKGGGYQRFPFRRYILSVAANRMLKVLFPIKGVRDYTIFYRSYSAKILRCWWNEYPPEKRIELDTFAANVELLIKLKPFSPKVAEIPMLYRYGFKQGKSKLKVLPTIYEYILRRGVFVRLFHAHKSHPSSAVESPEKKEPVGVE
jgi:dolichol-phosphate mannosyltransferase